MNIRQSMAGYIVDNRYEIFESMNGYWRIWDINKKNFITVGSSDLLFDSTDQAVEYLIDLKLVSE